MVSARVKAAIMCVIGTMLILFGVGLCAYLIIGQYLHCQHIWDTTAKAQEYASVLAYFFAVSKGAILIGVGAGAVPLLAGSLLLLNAHK